MNEITTFPTSAAEQLQGKRFISAEFIYRPRPSATHVRQVLSFSLDSRLTELSRYPDSAVLLVCDSEASAATYAELPAQYPDLTFVAALTNPPPVLTPDPYAETPSRSSWPSPKNWQRYATTDRWSRITFSLNVARQMPSPGYLIMPANDVVWGRGLLSKLTHLSERHAQNGLPAAVSPYTYYQHSSVPGVDIPQDVIDALNAAFNRDSYLRWRFRFGHYQSFWGKMGLIPFGMCAEILAQAETITWEDDLEIDRVIRAAGFAACCRWIDNPALYRQALPVFDRADLRIVIERTLHYSLNIPGDTSFLTHPLDTPARLRRLLDLRFARALELSESLTAECHAEIAARLQTYGCSWVDWGAYRYVVRVGDSLVQVWKLTPRD